MLFPIFNRSSTFSSNTAVRYLQPSFLGGWLSGTVSSSTTDQNLPAPQDMTVQEIHVSLTSAPGGVASWTFVLQVGGVDTATSFAITGAETSGSWSGSVSIPKGFNVRLKVTPSGSPTQTANRVRFVFSGTGQMLGGDSSAGVSSDLRHAIFGGPSNVSAITTRDMDAVMPADGVISDLYGLASIAPGAGNTVFMVYKNGVATTLQCTLTGSNMVASNNVDTVSVVAGDRVSILENKTSSGTARSGFSLLFTPTTTGQVILGGGENNGPSVSATNYIRPVGPGYVTWTATESSVDLLPGPWVVKKMYVTTVGAPGSGKSYDFTLRKNAGATSLTVNIADSATSANVTADVTLDSDDTISLQSVPNTTPSALNINLGLLLEPVPVPTTGATNFFF